MEQWGSGFHYFEEEAKDYLKDGEYFAKITNVVDNTKLDGAKNVLFQIKGHPAASPSSMTLFPRPQEGVLKHNGEMTTKENVEMWDRSMSRFFRAFNIAPGNFDFKTWLGHTAYITVKENKNDARYSQIYVAFNQHKDAPVQTPAQTAPANVQAVASAVGGTVSNVAPSPSGQGYSEDIPF